MQRCTFLRTFISWEVFIVSQNFYNSKDYKKTEFPTISKNKSFLNKKLNVIQKPIYLYCNIESIEKNMQQYYLFKAMNNDLNLIKYCLKFYGPSHEVYLNNIMHFARENKKDKPILDTIKELRK